MATGKELHIVILIHKAAIRVTWKRNNIKIEKELLPGTRVVEDCNWDIHKMKINTI
jgi:hypothetical protein